MTTKSEPIAVNTAPARQMTVVTSVTVRAEQASRYTSATAEGIHAPTAYIAAVLTTKPTPVPKEATAPSPPTPHEEGVP
jgi:multicomponent K+:H+ antiporter subunit D